MRLATVVLLGCIGGWSLGTTARAVELEERVPSIGAPAPDEAQPPPDSPQTERMQAMGICEQTVAERLENPSSAHWPDRYRSRYCSHSANGSHQNL